MSLVHLQSGSRLGAYCELTSVFKSSVNCRFGGIVCFLVVHPKSSTIVEARNIRRSWRVKRRARNSGRTVLACCTPYWEWWIKHCRIVNYGNWYVLGLLSVTVSPSLSYWLQVNLLCIRSKEHWTLPIQFIRSRAKISKSHVNYKDTRIYIARGWTNISGRNQFHQFYFLHTI